MTTRIAIKRDFSRNEYSQLRNLSGLCKYLYDFRIERYENSIFLRNCFFWVLHKRKEVESLQESRLIVRRINRRESQKVAVSQEDSLSRILGSVSRESSSSVDVEKRYECKNAVVDRIKSGATKTWHERVDIKGYCIPFQMTRID
ncbi:hypothetical protein V1477_008204 [Vespula maculifrons]|uniref:Uncharacterized protein n=1 Tax=Vespula maculifrons TaxID=7453 RepID=A0ABD2CCD4_VESMC